MTGKGGADEAGRLYVIDFTIKADARAPSGRAPRHRGRDPPIDQAVRDVAHAVAPLRLGRRAGGAGRLDEVPVSIVFKKACLRRELMESGQRYKGMSHSSQPTAASSRTISPQPTGFSQIHSISRGGGEGGGQAMSVLLSWHEKLVEIAGPGSIIRVMTDRRTV